MSTTFLSPSSNQNSPNNEYYHKTNMDYFNKKGLPTVKISNLVDFPEESNNQVESQQDKNSCQDSNQCQHDPHNQHQQHHHHYHQQQHSDDSQHLIDTTNKLNTDSTYGNYPISASSSSASSGASANSGFGLSLGSSPTLSTSPNLGGISGSSSNHGSSHRKTQSLNICSNLGRPQVSKYSDADLPKDTKAIDGGDLVKLLDNQRVVVFDVRPFNVYSMSRLVLAINICLPTTLLKRPSYNLPHILESITINQDIKQVILNQIDNPIEPLKVLVYDNDSNESSIGFQLYQILLKFGNINEKHPNAFDVYYLNRGFVSVHDNNLIECFNLSPNNYSQTSLSSISPISPIRLSTDMQNSATINDHNSQNVYDHKNENCLLSGFQLPSSAPSNQRFLSSMKKNSLPKLDIKSIVNQNNQPVGIDENLTDYYYKFKFPDGFNEKFNKLPQWIKALLFDSHEGKVVSNKLIINQLNTKFNKLEKSEQIRLKMAISDGCEEGHAPAVCSPNALCPGCDKINYKIPRGIEFGFKNRYNNIWPYEHSRVKLANSPCNHMEDGEQDDYFNANYIHDDISSYKYIATQNPLQSTYEDFWKTVWYNKVKVVVCLNKQLPADLMGQSAKYFEDQYFPNSKIDLKLQEMKTYEYFNLRVINLNKNGQDSTIYHLEYKDWPDFGVPTRLSTLIEFIKFKNQLIEAKNLSKQLMVHCSAGCGRTGCFIAVDSIIDLIHTYSKGPTNKLNPYGNVDLIYKSIQYQRTQRISMVQNLDQFIVCYEIILYYLIKYVL